MIYFLISKTKKIDDTQYELNRNHRSETRDALISFASKIGITSMDNIRTQLSMLSLLTSQTDEITRKSYVIKYSFFI